MLLFINVMLKVLKKTETKAYFWGLKIQSLLKM